MKQIDAVAPQNTGGGHVLRVLIPAALGALLLLSACKTPSEQAAAYVEQAQQLSDAGNQVEALKAIQKALAVRDDNADYFLLLGAIQMRAGNAPQAFLAARRALDIDNANRTALTLVANVGLQVGEVEAASDAAERLLALDPGSLIGLQVKGLVALYKEQVDEAERNAQRLLQISPADEAGTIIRARVMAKNHKYEDALALVDQTITQGRNTPALLITKINLYRALRRPEEMAKVFEQLMQQTEAPPAALQLDRINLLYKLGRGAEARAATGKLLAGGTADAKDLAVLQRIWSEFDRVPYTRDSIKAAQAWTDPLILIALGRYLLWQDQPQLADDLYFAYREGIRPVGISIHTRAQAGLGRVKDARNGVKFLLDRDAEDVDTLLLKGQFEMEDGNTGLAVEAVQKALDADPENPQSYVTLAGIHARAGDRWRAGQVFEDGLKSLPQNFLLIERYTQFLHESGNKARAVSVSRAFARALPSSVLAWTILARQCAWAGDAGCAAEAAQGRKNAATMFQVDDPPGTPPDRGLLGKFE